MTLDETIERWQSCDGCELSETRTNVVFGTPYYNEHSDEDPVGLVVGPSPGPDDDEQGEAFCGFAGQVLREEILAVAGVSIALLTNVIGCWTGPGSSEPKGQHVQACAPRLDSIFDIFRPDYVIAVGGFAQRWVRTVPWAKSLLRVNIKHPSYFLRMGHPNGKTRAGIRREVRKVEIMLRKLGVDSGSKEQCDHVFKEYGSWVDEDGVAVDKIICCTKCCRMAGS